MGFTTVYGTYDFLYIPVILPKALVKSFLPLHVAAISPSPFWDSSSIHRDSGVQLRQDDHIVVFHIGRQYNTGPWISKFNFQEAKLEIPYLHHPSLEPSTTKYSPFLLKQTVLLDSTLMTLSSRHVIGLRSIQTKYEPDGFPELMDQSDISKAQSGGVVDTLKLEVQYKAVDTTTDPENQWTPEIFQKMSSQPFYGESGSKVHKIVSDFEKPLRAIRAFSGSISIKLPVFQLTSEGETTDPDGLARCNCEAVDDDWLKITSNLLGYHVKVNFMIDGPHPPDYFSS